MDLETILRVVGAGLPVGGVVLAMAWLVFRPKVKGIIEEEIDRCQEHQGEVITQGFKTISKQIEGISDEVKYVRKRLDKHIDDG